MRFQGIVVKLDRGFPLVRDEQGREYRCKHATALVKGAKVRAVIGDKVDIDCPEGADMAQIVDILPRKNQFVRKDPAERAVGQVLAANFDTVIIAHPLSELNIRRLERELVLACETGARVVVALTKADLAKDGSELEGTCDLVREIVSDRIDIVVVSEKDSESVELLRSYIPSGTVAVLIGRSGVGKSSMVNLLAGSHVMDTTPVREKDGKGRHTTVSRAMIQVQDGGLVVDMPGVRGLGLWESEDGVNAAFSEFSALAQECRFRDCTHENEPGCAVLKAVEEGKVPLARVESYRNLLRENEEQRKRREEAERLNDRKSGPARYKGKKKRR